MGFEILDFPCDQFEHQAPGTNEEIVAFCDANFGITFTHYGKIDVNGEHALPLYQHLKSQKGFAGFDEEHPLATIVESMLERTHLDYKETPDIKWNFTKFLLTETETWWSVLSRRRIWMLSAKRLKTIYKRTGAGMKDKYDALKLENQLCFPLYACSKEIVRRYKPYLDEIDLTYTQYIAMMVLWEHGRINVKDMGALLYLDSGTLTPVLKKLEQKGYLTRERDHADERVLNVTITEAGEQLKEQAVDIPRKMGGCIGLSGEDARELYRILHKVLALMEQE